MALGRRFSRDVYKLNRDTKQHTLDALFTRVHREGKGWREDFAGIAGAGDEPEEERVAEEPAKGALERPGGEGSTKQEASSGAERVATLRLELRGGRE